MANAANSTELKTFIQAANGSDPTINLTAATTYSVTTLAKTPSNKTQPAVAFSGYTIQSSVALTPPAQGASSSIDLTRDFSNTRIYQQNIDGPYSPGLIKDVELSYSSGSYALLSARTGNFTLTNVKITGTHSGWAGNGNNYFSLINVNWAAPLSSVPITVPLTLTNVTVDITGQQGFNGVTGTGGSAFLHSWNNIGPVSITNSIFDESGFASTLNLLGTLAAPTGTYTISNNLFNRNTTPANRTVRPEGNRLQNVTATLSSNTFSDGSYIDLYGNISAIAFNGGNTFNTIAGGYGIRVTSPNSLTKPTFTGTTTFTGPGLALKYESASADFINYFNASSPATNTFNVNGVNYNRLIAGGQAADTMNLFSTLNVPPTNAWISGDGGNDSINAGPLNDFLLGGSGNDTLRGQTGDDIIDGGIGDDFIEGMGGNDTLTGGTGADKFRYVANVQSDIVTDFNASELDQLSLGGVAFTGSTLNNTLSASSFQQIAAPTSSPWAPSAAITNKVTILNTQTTTSLMNTVLATGQTAAYVMFFDGSKAWLYFDSNWSNVGATDRQALACFTNITSLGALTAFNNQQFFYA